MTAKAFSLKTLFSAGALAAVIGVALPATAAKADVAVGIGVGIYPPVSAGIGWGGGYGGGYEGGYEGGEQMRHSVHPGPWASGLEEQIVAKVNELDRAVGLAGANR